MRAVMNYVQLKGDVVSGEGRGKQQGVGDRHRGVIWLATLYLFLSVAALRRRDPTLDEGLHGGWLLIVVATQSNAALGATLAPQLLRSEEVVLFGSLELYLLSAVTYLLLIVSKFLFVPLTAEALLPSY